MTLALFSRPAPWRHEGARLREMRVKRGISLREIASTLDASIVTVGEWERGVTEHPPKVVSAYMRGIIEIGRHRRENPPVVETTKRTLVIRWGLAIDRMRGKPGPKQADDEG